MEAILFILTPLAGFVFMLTLIMAFVRMAAGRRMNQSHKYLLGVSFAVILFILIYVSVI